MNDWNLKGRTPVQYRRIRNFIDELRRAVFSATIGFQATYAQSTEVMPLAKTFTLDRNPVAEGEVWGRTWDSGYFHLQGIVPPGWEGKPLAAWLDLGGEALVYSATGEPLWSLTNGSAFDREYSKDVYRIGPAGAPGSKVELWIEAAANHLFGIDRPPQGADRAATDRFGTWEARVQRLRLGLFDEPTWHLALDLTVLIDLWERLDPESPRAARILAGAFEATTLWHGDPARSNLVRAHLRALWDRPAVPSAQATTAVGHAHIDTAWLWPLAETRRKVARTFASQLNLIERYPGYVFGASAPQHHQWVKEDHPALWARIQRAVAQGRWEPQGGMWIEADCNLPSGESLVRQVLHGKNFWRDEFGVDVKTCWIPDVFGYTPALPQILKKAGIDFFLTQKLSWSKFNTFPHDTFRWRGLDGSEVVTHFPPEDTYNSYGTPEGLVRAEKAFAEKAFLDEFLTLVGIGDGGGGPKEEHLEHLLRAQNTEGLPRVSLGGANGFFERLAPNRDRLEVWDGELYLEYHRGTFTTQAR
ncbi:MAG TPA: alpha-mannosidase 2c1, partial [Spirochaetia bacterium]|nr:alpha-mannosidase 2c1 [Spirochaetia bacterium]